MEDIFGQPSGEAAPPQNAPLPPLRQFLMEYAYQVREALSSMSVAASAAAVDVDASIAVAGLGPAHATGPQHQRDVHHPNSGPSWEEYDVSEVSEVSKVHGFDGLDVVSEVSEVGWPLSLRSLPP